MNRKILFLLSFVLLTVLSCKKSDSGNNWQIPMIKTATTNNETTTYSYDKNGRIVKLENGNWIKTEFTYTPDSVHYKTTELATSAVEKNSWKLNANGKVSSMGSVEYKYDANGRRTESLSPPQSNGWQAKSIYYYNSGTGLLDSVRKTESRLLQTNWLQTTIYTYFTTVAETHGIENLGTGFWGKNDLHPLKHSETWTPMVLAPFREITYTVDRSYNFDEAGRIVVENHRERRPDNSVAEWRTVYSYY